MSKHSLTMTVSATEPISGSFPIELEEPGLYLLSGPPEAGKSNILESLLFAYLKASGGNPKIDRYRVSVAFQARENAHKAGAEAVGQITLPGLGGPAGVKVYESQIRKLPAPPAVQILDGSPFTLLTRNGLEDPRTRQAAELKAFAAITQVRTTAAALVPDALAGEVKDLEAPADVGPDLLPDVAKRVAKRMHDLKGRFLDDAEATERKLNVCRDQADVEVQKASVGSVEQERLALATTEEKAAEVRIARRGRERAEQQQAQFRALQPAERPDGRDIQNSLAEARKRLEEEIEQASEGLPPEPDLVEAREEYDEAISWLDNCNRVISSTEADIARLQAQLNAARDKLTLWHNDKLQYEREVESARQAQDQVQAAHAAWVLRKIAHDQRKARVASQQREVDGLEQQARSIADQQRQWDERQRLIDQPVEGPEQADVDVALQAVASQRAVVEMARRKEQEGLRMLEEARLAHLLETQTECAKVYAEAATSGLKTRIGQVLAARAIAGWSIEDGVLMCHSPKAGKLIPFSDLSRSTQDTAALRLYIEHMPVEPSAQYHLILLPQEAFDGTTAAQRREMSRIAEAAGRYVLSAMVAEEGSDLKVVKI
jgi:energy-coupling factor transporter ATP-binding protein EcfA2